MSAATPRRLRVVAAVMDGAAPGEVWAFRRGPGAAHPGAWEFPGGKVEPGEDDRAALARELVEELDLPVDVGERLFGGPIDGPPALDIHFYRCAPRGGAAVAGRTSTDHDVIESVAIARLGDRLWAPGDVAFVAWLAGRGALDVSPP